MEQSIAEFYACTNGYNETRIKISLRERTRLSIVRISVLPRENCARKALHPQSGQTTLALTLATDRSAWHAGRAHWPGLQHRCVP